MTVFSNFGKYGIVAAGGGVVLQYSYLTTAFATTSNATLSGSNRIATLGSSPNVAYSNAFTLSGFQYLELQVTTSTRYRIASFSKHTATNYTDNHWGWYTNQITAPGNTILSRGPPAGVGTGGIAHGSQTLDAAGALIPTPADNDIFSWAFDVDAGKAWVGVNGVWHNGGGPAADSDPLTTGITSSDVTDLRFRFGNHAGPSGVAKILTEAESSYFNGGALF